MAASMSLLGSAFNLPSGNSLLTPQGGVLGSNVPWSLLARVTDLQRRIDLEKQAAASQSMTQRAAPFNVYVPFDKLVAYQSRMGGGGSQAPAAAPAAAPDVSAPTSAGYQPFKFAAYGRRQA